MSNEQIYLYRRKGLSDYATCDRARYVELSQHKLFETKVCYGRSDAGEIDRLEKSLTQALSRHADTGVELALLNDKLAKASAYVQKMVDCAGTQPSVATGYLRDILDALQERADFPTRTRPSKAGPIPAEMAELALRLSKGPSPEEVRRNQAIAMGIKIEPANKESAQ